MHAFTGKWLCAEEFAALEPIDVFFREQEKRDVKSAHPDELRNYRMVITGSFDYDGSEKVHIDLTADDYYKLYINGVFVCQGPTPGYYFDYCWNSKDISEYLVSGRNEIMLDVYYQGLINRVWNSGDLRMGAVFDIVTESGKPVCCSDESFVYARASSSPAWPKTGYDTQYMENIDLREEKKTLAEVKPCSVKTNTDYVFSDSPARLIDIYELEPKSCEKLENGASFYDFGQEIAASLKIRVKGEAGCSVKLYCGEETDENDPMRTRWNMRCNCRYEESIIFDGSGEAYVQYDYKAFRYATVLCDGCTIEEFKAVVRHNAFDDGYCTLSTDDQRLADVFRLCKNTIKYGTQEIYMDCPSREKGQYAGDMTITSASQLWLTGDPYMMRKAITNQLESSFICKGIMAVTPGSLMQEIADYSLQFPILALRDYEATGDRDFLARCYEACLNIVDYFRQYEREDGLLETVKGKWNLVDWPDNLRDGYDFKLTNPIGPGCHNVINAYYVGCVRQTEQIAGILGISAEKRSEELTEAFNNAFFDEKLGLYTDTETTVHTALPSNVIPAFYGLVPEGYEKSVGDFLIARGLCCGVYMAYFLLKALCRMGRYDDAYALIVNDSDHSWLNMIREGATTCMEAWGKDQKWNTSWCHAWATGPVPVLIEDFLGYRLDGTRKEAHLPAGVRAEITFASR